MKLTELCLLFVKYFKNIKVLKKGFSLLEILIALVLFLVGLLGLYPVFHGVQKNLNVLFLRFKAIQIADQQIQQFYSLPQKKYMTYEKILQDKISYQIFRELSFEEPHLAKLKIKVDYPLGNSSGSVVFSTYVYQQ